MPMILPFFGVFGGWVWAIKLLDMNAERKDSDVALLDQRRFGHEVVDLIFFPSKRKRKEAEQLGP